MARVKSPYSWINDLEQLSPSLLITASHILLIFVSLKDSHAWATEEIRTITINKIIDCKMNSQSDKKGFLGERFISHSLPWQQNQFSNVNHNSVIASKRF